ncbi:MAG: hypothetical protein ACKVWV_07015 [Planctomycetota bacterium]
MAQAQSIRSHLDRLEKRALLVGAIATVAVLAGAWSDSLQFFRSYLFSYLFWLGLSLGSLAIVMLHHITGGSWGFAIRRLLEAGMRTLPLMALLFVPFLFAISRLYPWADPHIVEHDELLQHKAPYLNTPFFIARAGFYFACWIGFALLLLRYSAKQDRTGDPGPERRARTWSGPGLALYGITMSFAAIDWAMSLEPHWISTIYGAIFIIGQVLSTLAFSIVVAAWLQKHPPFSRFLSTNHFHDLGNLMFAFVMLWAYVNFSQYLIIWSANTAEEAPWYLHRTGHGWQVMAVVLVVFHFAVPFLLLLSRKTKKRAQILATVAAVLLLLRFVDLYWFIGPAFHHDGFTLHWMDVVTPIALGGLWIAWYVRQLKGRPLISLQDAKLQMMLEAPAHD